ncbi:DNA topoisomerase III [Candidatus Bathyarchaeota archaeon]|nr:DNA topoisomerase III [Candidatus Bathyarchaeota archaeon]
MLVVTEKGSVAAAIRRAISPPPRTFALSGHLLNLDFPAEYNNWWRISPKELFDAPVRWTVRDTRTYRRLVEALKNLNGHLILATDNDHEGELIAYEVLQVAKKVLGWVRYMRMRFNTTSPRELREAWVSLEPDLNWGWVWKAYFRSKFDLVTGAAYTRLLTLSARRSGYQYKLLSWGSCQTPTLWFIYRREMDIRNFKPKTYYVLRALLDVKGEEVAVSSKPIADKRQASMLYEKVKDAEEAVVTGFESEAFKERRPLPTDTDTMLQELTKILGLSGAKIMALAEQLYADGYISYPRTQTNMWIRMNHRQVLDMLMTTPLSEYARLGVFKPRSGRKNDKAHPPIYPVKPYPYKDVKGRIWDYIARRYLANVVSEDASMKRWRLEVNLRGIGMGATGRYMLDEGFYRVFPYFRPKELKRIPDVEPGEVLRVLKVELLSRKTKPPPRLTESELLKLLEKHGIGTDATRHEYPTKVISRGYAEKRGRTFRLTRLGEKLINLLGDVNSQLVTPETRRLVEQVMGEVEQGKMTVDEALNYSLKIYRELYERLEEYIGKTKLEL